MNYEIVIRKIKEKYQSILKDNLIGIYIHGSVAFNCFNWDKSDIDFIIVVRDKLSINIKLKIMEETIKINEIAPSKSIEMSVVLEKYCNNFQYPTPFELHFSKKHTQWYNNDAFDYCKKMNGTDPDLAAHFTIIKKAGFVLYGQDIDEVFSDIPKEYYIESIKSDIKNAKDSIIVDPIYIILNLCRVAAFIENELVLSKQEGAKWGLKELDNKYHYIVKRALHCYQSSEQMNIKKEAAEDYCNYMLKNIFK